MAADIAPFPGSIDLTSGDLAEPGPPAFIVLPFVETEESSTNHADVFM